jgi:hypothetical protein
MDVVQLLVAVVGEEGPVSVSMLTIIVQRWERWFRLFGQRVGYQMVEVVTDEVFLIHPWLVGRDGWRKMN